ncbi:sorbitol dehydrogenase [Hyalella azteca]|uniref:Sorbitol dehydrogenase n=1 Tax=Hyalella azteca TaxID=294128 RepID=A0A979FYH9_HYAAZ|nr:sorbitol dehydrogenase [Hyalella azteca]
MTSKNENLAAVLFKANDLRVVNKPMPPPTRDDDVLLRMGRVGICGTDLSYLSKGKMGTEPIVLGHEAAGTVLQCGANVKHLKPGDRVAVEPNLPCHRCEYCMTGRYNLCQLITKVFMSPDKGNLCHYYRHPAAFCHKLPENVSLEEGAFLEPLSCAVHAVRRAGVTLGVTLGTRLLICGAGPIGVLSMMVARSMGATRICITDLNKDRLSLAKQLGADSVIHVTPGRTEKDLAMEVREKLGGRQPNVTMDCSGAEASIRLAIEATESGGRVALVGLGPREVKVPLVDSAIREVDIFGVFCYANDFKDALELVASGRVNVKALITHRFPLVEANKAFETARSGAAMKVVIACD